MNNNKDKQTMSVLIPVHNEELTLEKLFEELCKVKNKIIDLEITLIFIDDGSTDKSSQILEDLSKNSKFVKIISFARNFGHMASITAGLNSSKEDYVVMIDADLQDPPSEIEHLYLKALQGYDVVYGKRLVRKGETIFKKLSAKYFYYFFNYISETKIPNNVGEFRLITRKVVNELKNFKEKNKFIRGLIPWMGFNYTFHEYVRNERYAGTTKYNFFKMLKLALDGSISFSSKIINFFSILSIIVTSLSFLYGLYLTIYKLIYMDKIIPGFTALITCIIFFSGIILFFLSIIAQYIIKIQDQVKDRPEYIIKKLTNF